MSKSIVTEANKPLYSMVYISKINIPKKSDIDHVVSDILREAKKHNTIAHISGVLCYFEQHFFQYIEASEEALNTLKVKLEKDDRHSDIQYLDFSTMSDRRFLSWEMRYYNLEYLIKNARNQFTDANSIERMKRDAIVWQNFVEELSCLEPVEHKEVKYTKTLLDIAKRLFR